MSESSSYFDLAGRLEESFAEIEDTITVDLRRMTRTTVLYIKAYPI